MNRTEQEEIRELMSAVEHFAQAMKVKLLVCARKGKRGWDGEHPQTDLCEQIMIDAENMANEIGNQANLSVDVGNRAMMLWYRVYGKSLMHGE